ncbi:hypothetical protein D3874_19670 [Oleomonas cavernae]|uniref:Growth inhibitor PemK n=1 Tax=Oleomonas cavernae TaxID=2320859 RepID=A0A418WFX4_9PROT|nr:hypothetical protein D3874_19670 [Oleomonas cavernae]
MVVRYDYLWHREQEGGRVEASKSRPACIVLADEAGQVIYVAITHRPPAPDRAALELPADEKRRLGLDDQRSWVMLDEINIDQWAQGLEPVPGRPNEFAYGRISYPFLRRIIDGVDGHRTKLRRVRR